MKKIFALMLFCVAFTLTSFNLKGKTELSLTLKKGNTYYHASTSKLTINQKIEGKEVNSYMTLRGKMSFKVTDVNDSIYELETKYVNISMSMRIMDKLTEYDSESADTTDLMSRILSKLTDEPFTVYMRKNGKVKSIKNIEVLFTKMMDDFPNIPDATKAEAVDKMRQSYGEKAFIGSIESVTAIFPDKEVSVSDKWKVSTQLGSGEMKMKVETTYELSKLTGDYALIKGNGTVKTINKDTYTEANGMMVKYALTGTVTSKIKVHNLSGWIIESEVDQNIKGTVDIKDNPKIPGGMSIPMEMISETKILEK